MASLEWRRFSAFSVNRAAHQVGALCCALEAP